jgi:lipoprotein-anchoring transpeptidase ErfK/SrfK
MGRRFRWSGAAGVLACAALAAAAGTAVAQEAPPGPGSEPLAAQESPPARGPVVAQFRSARAITYGDRARVAGRIAPAAARTRVVLERRRGARWVPLATVSTDARGRFGADLPLRSTVALRARPVAGPAQADGAPGPVRTVSVRRRVVVDVSTHEYESIAGRPFAVRGAVVPSRNGEGVLVEGSRNGGAWLVLGRMRVRDGRVSGAVTPRAGGHWRFRLSAPGRPGAGEGSASRPTAPRRVFEANPHAVPASSPRFLVQKISEAHLYYYESGQLVRVLPVVFGKPSTPTPIGNFRVYSRTAGPGPAFGPLALWYYGNYGIHGTNQEHLLRRSWRYFSKGCTRNFNANIYWLWDRVPVGTPVRNIR